MLKYSIMSSIGIFQKLQFIKPKIKGIYYKI
jgi:hypothetical protein